MKLSSTPRDLWIDMEAVFDSVHTDGCSFEFHEVAAAILRLIAVRADVYQPRSITAWLNEEANRAAAYRSLPD